MSFLKGCLIILAIIFAIILWPLWVAIFELWPFWLILVVPILAVYGLVKLVSSIGKG